MIQDVDTAPMEKIDYLNKKLKDLEKEIADYQNNCKHGERMLKAQENNDIRFVCKRCLAILGWPNPDELKDWLKR